MKQSSQEGRDLQDKNKDASRGQQTALLHIHNMLWLKESELCSTDLARKQLYSNTQYKQNK
jgi:hypothetical protein